MENFIHLIEEVYKEDDNTRCILVAPDKPG